MTAEIKNGLGQGKNETNIRISVPQGVGRTGKRSVPGIASNFAARLYYDPAAGRRSRGTLDVPPARRMPAVVTFSQFSGIGKRKRAHPPRVFVEDQRAGDRRLGALAAILALAEPAVDADRRAFGFFQIHAGRIDQFRRVADLAAQADRK